jgi:hypothetical protein
MLRVLSCIKAYKRFLLLLFSCDNNRVSHENERTKGV